MKFPCILLSAQGVSFKSEDNGSPVEGTTVYYITTDNLAPYDDEDFNLRGYKVSKAWLSSKLARKIKNVPAIYDMSFDLNTNSKFKNELRVRDLEYFSDIKLELC